MDIETLAAYGDALAIIGFALLVYYFHKKEKRTRLEIILTIFAWIGLLVDSFLTVYRYILL